MNSQLGYANAAPAQVQTREQRLQQSWEKFAGADQQLRQARAEECRASENFAKAKEQLRESEEYWEKASQELGVVICEEAPEKTKASIAAMRQAGTQAPSRF